MQQKKPYVAPTLTVHGPAVEKTQGTRGRVAELINFWKGHDEV
jgi:hypothetical protein